MDATRPNRIPWPPIIYLTSVLAGILLQRVLPLPWFEDSTARMLSTIGLLLALVAIGFDLWAMVLFQKHKTTILPNQGATRLITTGPFSWSRNPIYLGNTMLTAAVGLYFGNAWLIILAPIAAYVTQKLAIEREEIHLAAVFGTSWHDYARKVRRWL
jgi:protein-S-isoprenylcysteine O-methyltransferase Ste14